MNDMLTPEEAQQVILDRIKPLGTERVSLLEAAGRALARPVRARRDNPPHDNSAMDGYAVRWDDVAQAADGSVVLEMIEDIPAGYVGEKQVEAGQASRIMTGAPVPEGADTIVPVEDTRADGVRIEILEVEEAGAHIRRQGEDLRQGEVVLEAGTRCGPGEVAVLAAVQQPFVEVGRQPTVAILSTGDELVEVGQPLAAGQIVDSNSYALAALARSHGAVPVMHPIVRDSQAAVRQAVEAALQADFILSSGGVSVGEYDYIKTVLDDMGAQTVLWRVAMKPGKPLFFCLIQGRPYFGLPGNPVSSAMSFLQFVRPAVGKASGLHPEAWLLPTARARLDGPVDNDGDRRQYLRARLRWEDGRLWADPHRGQGSHMLSSLVGANGIVVLGPNAQAASGDEVEVQIIGEVHGS